MVGEPDEVAWLRYRHVVPWNAWSSRDYELQAGDSDWLAIEEGRLPERFSLGKPVGQLVTDHYAYNNGVEDPAKYSDPIGLKAMGVHWVGDLAVECEGLQVGGDSGDLLLDLVEGGVHYTCHIDVSTGNAELSIDGGGHPFVDEEGNESLQPTATTKVVGPGRGVFFFYQIEKKKHEWVVGHVG